MVPEIISRQVFPATPRRAWRNVFWPCGVLHPCGGLPVHGFAHGDQRDHAHAIVRSAFDAVDAFFRECHGEILAHLAAKRGCPLREHTLDGLGIVAGIDRHEFDGVAGLGADKIRLEDHHPLLALVEHPDLKIGCIARRYSDAKSKACRQKGGGFDRSHERSPFLTIPGGKPVSTLPGIAFWFDGSF